MENLQACIFNIQKFSLNDGPGIRTVVFFKGCPLACLWCSNPESQSVSQQMAWEEEKCVRCMRCVHACKQSAVKYLEDRMFFDEENCVGCFQCVKACPQGALSVQGDLMTLVEVLKEIMKDVDFYEESGGGVTLSGGEVLGQADFAIALLKELQARQIHTACETTGYADEPTFSRFIEHIDLILFDLKHYDNEKHIAVTNVSNEPILRNLKLALAKGKEVMIRIPVIPGINDTLKDAQGFCDLLRKLGAKNVNLLPFHQFGQKKYSLLGKEYQCKDLKQLHEEDLRQYREVFLQNGLVCSF